MDIMNDFVPHTTVGELIKKLQVYNPELVVYIEDKGEWLNHVKPSVRLEDHSGIELGQCVVLGF